jgi:hypothetical protein
MQPSEQLAREVVAAGGVPPVAWTTTPSDCDEDMLDVWYTYWSHDLKAQRTTLRLPYLAETLAASNTVRSGAWVPAIATEEEAVVLRCALHDATVHVGMYSADSFAAVFLTRTSTKRRPRSVRHYSFTSCTSLAELLALLEDVAATGLCEPDAVIVPAPAPWRPRGDAFATQPTPWFRQEYVEFPWRLPPYAEATCAAFEAANHVTLPPDLRWFLTHVSREISPGRVVKLVRKDAGLGIVVKPGRRGREQRSPYVTEALSILANDCTDAGRRLQVRHNPGKVWDPVKSSHWVTLPEFYAETDADTDLSAEGRAVFERDRAQMEASGLEFGLGQAWEQVLAARQHAPVDEVDAAAPEDAIEYGPWRCRDGCLRLANFGCTCDLDLVLDGPFAGCVLYEYQLLWYTSGMVVFPSFAAFVHMVLMPDFKGPMTYDR